MTANPNLASDQKYLGDQGASIDDKAPPCSFTLQLKSEILSDIQVERLATTSASPNSCSTGASIREVRVIVHIQAALAFALTMMALATVVTVIQEILLRIASRRRRHFEHMLKLVYDSHVAPEVASIVQADGHRRFILGKVFGDEEVDFKALIKEITEIDKKNPWMNALTIKWRLHDAHSHNGPLLKLLTALADQWSGEWNERRRATADVAGKDKSKTIDYERTKFLEERDGTVAADIESKLGVWFARSIMSSPFEPNRLRWMNSALSKVANWLGADRSSELTQDEFLRRFARNGVGKAISEKKSEHVSETVEEIALRYDEVAEGAREYFKSSNQIMAMLIGIVLALSANIEGFRIFKGFVEQPATAEQLIENKDEYKKRLETAEADFQKTVTELGKANGEQSRQTKESLDDAVAAFKEVRTKLAALVTEGIAMGWSEFPHCRLSDSQSCPTGAPALGFQQTMLWLICTMITGMLIGLGGPFWYDAVKGLTRATQILRGRGVPAAASGQADADTTAKKTATEIFGSHAKPKSTEEAASLRSQQLDRYRQKIKKMAGIEPPKCSAFRALPRSLDWPPGMDPKTLQTAKQRYELYVKACEKLQEESR